MSFHPDRVILRLVRRFMAALYEAFPYLLAVNRREIDISAKCPACGIRKPHVVTWNATTRFIIHSCVQCKADFAQSPITPFDKWQKKITEASE